MDVQCERCKTEYEFDDALVSGRGTTVRCTHCGHQFKVRRADAANGQGDRWSVTTADGRELTFVTLRELQRAIMSRQLGRNDTLVVGGTPPRRLGSIAELEPFLEGRASSDGFEVDTSADAGAIHGAAGVPLDENTTIDPPAALVTGPAPPVVPTPVAPHVPAPSTAHWPAAAPAVGLRAPAAAVHVPARRTESFGAPPEAPRAKMDTLRPPLSGAVPPPAAAAPPSDPSLAAWNDDVDRADPRPIRLSPEPLLPVARDPQASPPRDHMPSLMDDPFSVPRPRRVGGWVVAAVLLLAVGAVGWIVARPYLVGHEAGATAPIDPRAQAFLADGEKAMADGDLELAQQDFDKASALAEREPRVLLDEARLATAKADVPWLKVRLLPADANDDLRAARLDLSQAVERARQAGEAALAASPNDPIAVRTSVDALRLAGDRDGARARAAKLTGQASQPETAYVLGALDLAEAQPIWATVLDRLRLAAGAEGNVGRAKAALVYALVRSGDVAGAKAELIKLDALTRPYPLMASLRVFVDKAPPQKADAGVPSRAEPPPVALGAPAVTAPMVTAAGATGAGGPAADVVASDPRLGMRAASAAIHKGDWRRARQIYEALVAKNPSDSEALSGIGDCARGQGDSAGAVSAYRRAIAVNPSYLPALLGLADTEWASGDRAGAARSYRDIVDRFPEGTFPAYVKARAEGGAPSVAPPAPAGGANDSPPSAPSAAAPSNPSPPPASSDEPQE